MNTSKLAVSIDIETMGQGPTSAITSIGACLFDPAGTYIGEGFHRHVMLDDCLQLGLQVDASTLIWWMAQSEDARLTLINGQADAYPLHEALELLTTWMPEDSYIWCNGASFDFPILKHAFQVTRRRMPWKYWHERDLRTLKGLNADLRIQREGTHHNALDDATHQARLIQHILQFNQDQDA